MLLSLLLLNAMRVSGLPLSFTSIFRPLLPLLLEVSLFNCHSLSTRNTVGGEKPKILTFSEILELLLASAFMARSLSLESLFLPLSS